MSAASRWKRLADYFCVVGYQPEPDGEGGGVGKVIQRFPETDWNDVPFTPAIELFCQPGGWELSDKRQDPTFYVSFLTDSEGGFHYGACLTFYEPYDEHQDIEDEAPASNQPPDLVHHSLMFAPKSLVLVSELDYFDTFRNCLGIIYTVYVEGNYSCRVEQLVGNILGCVMVPPPGGPQVRFTIGAGDKQAIQPALSSTLPVTRTTVSILFQELGIYNVMLLVCAALTDHKILFTSQSYIRLGEASTAISALLYPLKYSYVYIPLLPAALVDVLDSPTPFIAGIHSSLKSQTVDLLDVIIVDCDNGSVKIPECVQIPWMPEPMNSRLQEALSVVLNPDLDDADCAFQRQVSKTADLEKLDKEIRACFIRFFAELFNGYRSCLQIVRIHTEPVIQFHKAKFLGVRNLVECEFSKKLMESMCFLSFVQSRGAPYRVCDVFDEAYSSITQNLQQERADKNLIKENIQKIAHILYVNENPSTQPFTERIPKPTDGSSLRLHLPKFPIIDWLHVQEIVDNSKDQRESRQKHNQHIRQPQKTIVLAGTNFNVKREAYSNQLRRLAVLNNCVRFIFENKISDARKIYPAVLLTLKNKLARQTLADHLQQYAKEHKRMLDHNQFILVVKLLNALLQNESPLDENGVAAKILPLAETFCRKLTTGVIQFAYTCVQEHAVWSNQQFWEATFYEDVQNQIRKLYQTYYNDRLQQSADQPSQGSSGTASSSSCQSLTAPDVTCLEIAAEEMGKARYSKTEDLTELANNEEQIVYSQAIHYCNRMVYLKVPLDLSRGMPLMPYGEDRAESSNLTPSIADSNSIDAESGFEEQEVSEVTAGVTKVIGRFIEKVCKESGVSEKHMKNLNQMVPGVVSMHVETIEHVCRESKRLPPILKPKITEPCLLPGEELLMEGLRAYLLIDGREEYQPGAPGPQLLPAEGAIFLTTYRIVFKGTPCDQYACEQTILRSSPVSAIDKEKKCNSEFFPPLETYLQHVIQLKTYNFQSLKFGFDEEVGDENVDTFRKRLVKLRTPPNVLETFAFIGASVIPVTPDQKRAKPEKYHTLSWTVAQTTIRDISHKTLKKVKKAAGMKSSKAQDRKQKYVLSGHGSFRGLHSVIAEDSDSRPPSVYGDDPDNWSMLSIDESLFSPDQKTQEKLSELLCYRDFVRLELIGSQHTIGQKAKNDRYFLSNINCSYKMCRSYPGLLIFPNSVSDESIMRFGRSHRQNRFPVITWRHPKTKALLLRASAFHHKSSVMNKLKSSSQAGTSGSRESTGSLSTSYEMEKYLNLVSSLNQSGQSRQTNTLSTTLTPRTAPNYRQKAGKRTDRRAAESSSFTIGPGSRPEFSSPGRTSFTLNRTGQTAHIDMDATPSDLIIVCEKNQSKIMKADHVHNCEWVSMDFRDVAQVKISFKKLMRACMPSKLVTDPEHSFSKNIDDSGWLSQVQNIMANAAACVNLLDGGASVVLALEDGWDFTCQISSVTQLLLDPYYRTFEGFRTLIEKEWLSFGHRFSHRSHQTANSPSSSFAPIFLQFLDVVHQIHNQFPMSFEFNQFYIKTLGYHHLSNRFRTFMLDSELERLEAGWLLDERPRIGMAAAEVSMNFGNSIWDYIDLNRTKSTTFYNPMYLNEEMPDMVLRPHSNMANLCVWSFYMEENLAHGPPYDIELVNKESRQQSAEMSLDEDSDSSGRVIVNNCYDYVEMNMPHIISTLLQEIAACERDLNQFPSKWGDIVDRHEQINRESFRRQYSLKTQYYRSHGRNVHKRSTMEFLVKGKMANPSAIRMFSQSHVFEKYAYNTPQPCDYCSKSVWNLFKPGLKCTGCGYNCHEKCMSHVPKNCSSRMRDEMNRTEQTSNGGNESRQITTPTGDEDRILGQSQQNENRTFEGYLCKQGVLLKGWKQRWFVLDFLKHQLRYYDEKDDTHCRGFIDLADVVQISPAKPPTTAPKRVDDASFFEMKTNKRQYIYYAETAELAHKWMDMLQSRIIG